ncbi:MAG: DUF413 domain-containing protein [Pyrinomonadaceae bacterium]
MEVRDYDLTGDFYLGLNYTKDKFSKKEIRYLLKHGQWLHALIHKMAEPTSVDARHFVEVFSNGAECAEPITMREHLWKKYLIALDEEKEIKKQTVEEAKKSPRYKLHEARISAP